MTTRLPPSNEDDWSEEVAAILQQATPAAESPDGEGPPNILFAIGHHPRLLTPFLAFSATLATRGVLPRRESEVLALRASWNCRSEFEWGHHVEYGVAEGLTAAEIDALADGPSASSFSARERLLVRTADALHAHQNVSAELWSELRAQFSEAEIVELCFVVGQYTMLSMVANATGVPLEKRLPAMPER